MSKLQERLNHIGELVRGLSEQTSGNITIINSNCQMLENRLEEIEKKVQDLETKTASDLSQTVVAESTTSEEQDCFWVARDEGGLFAFSEEPEFFRGEWSSDSDYHKLPANLFPQVTFENSPQKLVLESSISKMETVEKEFDRERALELVDIIDFEYWDCVTNKVMENSIEELRQMIGGSDE